MLVPILGNGQGSISQGQEKNSKPFSEQLICSWAETVLRGPTSGGREQKPQREQGDPHVQIQLCYIFMQPQSSMAVQCPCSPPLAQQHGHTSTRSSRQISQGKRNHEHSPSYGFILSPRHKASSDFWIFPSLFTSQWLSRIWRNLSRSTPLMLGCRQKRKTVLREKMALDSPSPVKQRAMQWQGNPPKEKWPKWADSTSVHTQWGSKQRMGKGCPAKPEGVWLGAWDCE